MLCSGLPLTAALMPESTYDLLNRLLEVDPSFEVVAFTIKNSDRTITVGPKPNDDVDNGGRPMADVTDVEVLTDAEATALAWRLIGILASEWAEHVEWEDVPHLAQQSWDDVCMAMDRAAVTVLKMAQEVAGPIDARDVFYRAIGVASDIGGDQR